jgi:hypothetical protein
MPAWMLPADLTTFILSWAAALHARSAPRLLPLLVGHFFAKGRRTVASWLRAGRLGKDFRRFYYFIGAVGRNTKFLAWTFFVNLRRRIPEPDRWVFALDDTPTARYRPMVEGAGIHHNPTPGPADRKFVYGHIWVTLSWVVQHPRWGSMGLPLLADMYIRQKDLPKIPPWVRPPFQTKHEQAIGQMDWLRKSLPKDGKPVWLGVDGAYASKQVLRGARERRIVVVSRLRKDAALYDLPPVVPPEQRGRGRPRIYGCNRISLAKRAAHRDGWDFDELKLYGKLELKQYKTFLATWRPAGGVIRVVIVREVDSCQIFFCTDANASVADILGTVADRNVIEQDFHDVKEVEGAGEQQVRNLHANIGAYHLNLWAYGLVEWWAWDKPKREICDRRDSPWDDPTRRPSHADRRKALQRASMREELSQRRAAASLPRKIWRLLKHLLDVVR